MSIQKKLISRSFIRLIRHPSAFFADNLIQLLNRYCLFHSSPALPLAPPQQFPQVEQINAEYKVSEFLQFPKTELQSLKIPIVWLGSGDEISPRQEQRR